MGRSGSIFDSNVLALVQIANSFSSPGGEVEVCGGDDVQEDMKRSDRLVEEVEPEEF